MDYDQEAVRKPGCKAGSNRTSGHHLGPGRVAVIPSRGVAVKQGFLCSILRAMQSGLWSVTTIGRVVDYQGWSLRGVPLYIRSFVMYIE